MYFTIPSDLHFGMSYERPIRKWYSQRMIQLVKEVLQLLVRNILS